MKLLTKSLISAGVLVSTIVGLAILVTSKSDKPAIENSKASNYSSVFWAEKLENFRQELLNLKKQGKEKELTEKIFDSGSVLFDLTENGNFYHGVSSQQIHLLSWFCDQPEKEKITDNKLITKIC